MTTKLITTTLSTLLMFGASFVSLGQSSSIWTTIENYDKLGLNQRETKLVSTNPVIQNLISDLNIESIEKAVPAAKTPSLQSLYDIKCNCDENDLLAATAKLNEYFQQPEIGPKYELLYDPNDFNTVFSVDYALSLINAKGAWDITKGSPNTVIAISDQNFNVNHEELVGKVNYYDATNVQNNYHGTAVAITAAGASDNGLGKSSIGFNCGLSLYRMNYNDLLTASNNGYRVINCSWSSGCYASTYVQTIIDEIYNNGTIIVASAGNGGTCGGPNNLVYPSACNHVISVSSVGPMNNHERYIGNAASTHQHNATVDICAPGYDVALSCGPGWYLTGNGTSFAAPYVSGTIGLMLTVDPCLSFEQVEEILKSTATDVYAANPQYLNKLGAGRLNAASALMKATTYHSCKPGNGNGAGGNGNGNGNAGNGNNGHNNDPNGDGNNGGGNDVGGFDPSNPGVSVYVGSGHPSGTEGTHGNGGNGGNGGNNLHFLGDFNTGSVTPVNPTIVAMHYNKLKNTSIVTVDNEYYFENGTFYEKNVLTETIQTKEELTVYPNPSVRGTNVKIETNETIVNVRVYDLNGMLVSEEFNSRGVIGTDNLIRGAYFVKAELSGGAIISKKLVIIE